MKLSQSVKSLSYFKTHASELINECREQPATYIITQNGEASAVVQDIKSYEKTQDQLTMLKILALSEADVEAKRTISSKDVFKTIYKKLDHED